MPDYNKLTVANLRATLKEQGIPATGLTRKQQLIDRLERADREGGTQTLPTNGVDKAVPDAIEGEPESGTPVQAEPVADATTADDATIAKISGVDDPSQAEDAAPPRHATVQPVEDVSAAEVPAEGTPVEQPMSAASSVTLPAEEPEQLPVEAAFSTSQTPVPSHEAPLVPPPEASSPKREMSAQTSKGTSPLRLNTEEVTEDNRKRKRRSASPPVDADEAASKRMRQDDEAAVVHLKEDVVMGEPNMEGGATATIIPSRTSDDVVNVIDTTTVQPDHGPEFPVFEVKVDAQAVSVKSYEQLEGKDGGVEDMEMTSTRAEANPQASASAKQVDEETTSRRSPSPRRSSLKETKGNPPSKDNRYKNLLPPSSDAAQPTSTPLESYDDLSATSPSLHPATRGLYIRNFMRPLHPNALRTHLIALASPPSAPPDDSVLETFHLDPIRTHALALFSSVAAASRVRSALHGRVWPAERDRKPLWADFVPEEKVEGWIEMEEHDADNGGPRGARARKWEVVYEEGEGGAIEAVLREVGQNSAPGGPRGRRTSAQMQQQGAGVANAPIGPRGAGAPPPGGARSPPIHPSRLANPTFAPSSHRTIAAAPAPPPPRAAAAAAPQPADSARAFLALDDLFRSTTAKPKLYFQPMDATLAARRLEELARCTSRDWKGRVASVRAGEELRRYSFEDGDVLVDGGVHFPGPRERERGGRGRRGR